MMPRLGARQMRLLSGLVLGAFILCHFSNHALGLVSLEAMEAARPYLAGIWRTKVATVLLYGAVAVHFALILASLHRRRSLRMSLKEGAQYALGLGLPLLLVGHVVGTRVDFAFTGVETTYPQVMRAFWIDNPTAGLRQTAALLIAWLHFCLGLYFWLRSKQGLHPYRYLLFAAAVLLPTFSMLGFVEAGREVARLPSSARPGGTAGAPAWIETAIVVAFLVPLAGVLLLRAARAVLLRGERVRIGYPDGRSVEVEKGTSVLEGSRLARVPHQAVCGGRARCSTCRVEVLRGGHGQPRPGADEQVTLRRIGAGAAIRLACQFRPVRNVEVAPLLSVQAEAGAVEADAQVRPFGRERDVVVLFCDLRGFTGFTERSLPYDVMFILNRYFEIVGTAVAANGGTVDKFIGDGAMVLFGLETEPGVAVAQALAAAKRIAEGVARLNQTYASEMRGTLHLVVALHFGPAIVGTIGYGRARSVTAIGDTVNVASRLEGLAKERDADLVLSDDAARHLREPLAGFRAEILPIRGRSQPMTVWLGSASGETKEAASSNDAA